MNNIITLPINELKPALSGLGKLINTRATLAVLKTLRVERTAEGWICLTATDLDHFATVRLEQPAKGEPLAILIPYEDLLKLTKTSSKGDQVHLESTSKNTVTMRFNLGEQTGETTVKGFPVEEFPEIPRIQGKPIPLPESLRLSLHEAMACVSTDVTRYTITGACIDTSQPNAHYIVGTDGRHLYSCNSFNLPLKQSLIIPKHKLLGWKDFNIDGEWQLRVPEDNKQPYIQISSRRWRFITKTIEGSFPNWRQVLPDKGHEKTTLTLDPDKLEAVMQLIERLPNHDEQYQTIGIQFKDKEVVFLARNKTTAPCTRTVIPGCKAQGKPVTVFLDRRYLSKALDFGLCTIAIIDEMSPLRFHQGGRQMIVMPVRAKDGPASASTPPPTRDAAPARLCASNPPPQPETKTMPNNPPPSDQPASHTPTLDEIAGDIIEVRQTIQGGLLKLRDVSLKLKQVHRGQRSSDRELQSVRSTLQSLQRLRL